MSADDDYRALKRVTPQERSMWLRRHAPSELRGHWWLALIERAQSEADPSHGLPADQVRERMEFAVELIEAAQDDGMAPHYAASRLAFLTSAILRSEATFDGMPDALIPDNLARRILGCFRLDIGEALVTAARSREMDLDDPGDEFYSALRDITWLLPDLRMLAPHLEDPTISRNAIEWLDIAPQLSQS